ncbi:MAG TPA: hypothetical protein VII94_01670, partial [Candidatus Saccharimonadales bacterium]
MKKINNEYGFSAVELILVIAVIALLGVVGWLVYKNDHKTTITTVNKNTTSATTSANKSNSGATTTSNTYSGWKTYTLPVEKLSFRYPSGWTASNTTPPTATQDQVTLTASDGFTFNIE